MNTIQITVEEYDALKKEIELLKHQDLLKKMNELLDLMFESKYGLYIGNNTDDLTEYSLRNLSEWNVEGDVWDEV